MARFLISFDTHGTPRNYASFNQLVINWGAVRLTDSLWMANLNGPASAVLQAVLKTLDANDTIAVIELKPGSDWETFNVSRAASTWLSANISPARAA